MFRANELVRDGGNQGLTPKGRKKESQARRDLLIRAH